jgi:quercetin dioxygenase-like cupin family protein
MKTSRRRFAMLLPAIAAAQETAKRLPSQAFPFENLPSKISAVSKTHAVFTGETHTGYPLEVHVTELNAGASPHPPHQHLHEEMFCMQSGILDATVNGKTTRLTAGSVLYINSHDLHGVHNPGPDKAEYFVIALGPEA